jgi:protein-tyrosine kinase
LKHKGIRQRNLISYLDSKSTVSEAFRTLRTNIQFASMDKEIKTMMITSAGPIEGKSTVASNLAVVLAQAGRKTILIDGDMRNPSLHDTFRVLNSEGLSHALVWQKPLEELILDSGIKNLDILTSGPIPPNPAELMASEEMSTLIEKLCDRYDVILFDTPPLIAVTDPQILASQLDGVILVIHSGRTNREQAFHAKKLLNKVKANILGCVLNGRRI